MGTIDSTIEIDAPRRHRTQTGSESKPVARRPRIAIVTSALPPQLDGIGDHSSRLAGVMSAYADVTIYTAEGFVPDAIRGIRVVQAFDPASWPTVMNLIDAIVTTPPDWLIVQYNPFCYGRRGFNPYLARALRQVRRACPRMRLAVMIHEMYMPANSPANTLMSMYQRWQFAAITSIADLSLFSTGPWHDDYRRRHPTRCSLHMPVGSNLNLVSADREDVRVELGLPPDAIVLGTFGGHHPSRLLDRLAEVGHGLRTSGYDVRILAIGPAGPVVRAKMSNLPIIDLGSLAPDSVSRYFRAIDIYCCPFFDGVSTRRGSFFAGMQHGLAVVTTDGYHTDDGLRRLHGDAILAVPSDNSTAYMDAVLSLARDPRLRHTMGERARKGFESNYALPVLAQKWRDALELTADEAQNQ